MLKFIIKRILMVIPVLIGVSIIVFCLLRVFAPDPAPIVLGQHATQASMQKWRDANGLNKPVTTQYLEYVQGIFKGDLGKSYYTQTKVTDEIKARFPATIELAITAIIFATIFGIILGVIAAVKKNSILDAVSTLIALVGVSIPIFWLGILLMMIFCGPGKHFISFPAGGRITPLMSPAQITGLYTLDALLTGNWASLQDAVRHLVLPAFTLGMYSMAIITRITRSTMLDSLNQDYVRTARAKGIREIKVVMKHALRNSMIPVTTVIGLQFGGLLGGALLTESVFSWPGIGKFMVGCILNSDFPIVQGIVLLVAVIFVLVNLAADIGYAFLDPRIRYTSKKEG
ncbi:MAG: ABC transporter permease [Actinomycetia bacterium]|nr:ABC transporter permease [Actinomycetes bacterium]